MSFRWDDPAVETLKTLWAEGLSCSQIARAIGEGLTRNAVIGKVTRLGLTPRGNASRYDSGHRISHPKPRPSGPPRTKPPAADAPPAIGELNAFSAAGTCQWIHGEVGAGDWQMCGQSICRPGSPWCDFHHAKSKARA